MVLKVDRIFIPIFFIVIFCQLFITSFRANIAIQILFLTIIIFLSKKAISHNFYYAIVPLFFIFFLGMTPIIYNDFNAINYIKDISHFIKPILGISIGYFIFKKMHFDTFIKTIVVAGFLSAIVHFCFIIIFGKLGSESINEIRGSFGRDNFLELFSLLFILFYRKYYNKNVFKNRKLNIIITTTLLLSNVLYFSRTMIISFIIASLSIYGFTKINRKSIKFILGFLIFISLFYAYLFTIKLERDKPGLEALLYKIKIAPSELFVTKINRENHQELWDHWRGYEVKMALDLMDNNPSSYVVGAGFGSLIDLKFRVPLENKTIRYVSEIHNGYVYIFYKTGIIGLICIFAFMLSLYGYIRREATFTNMFISIIGLIFFFTTLTITGIYNARDIIIIILGGLLAHSKSKTFEQKKEYNE